MAIPSKGLEEVLPSLATEAALCDLVNSVAIRARRATTAAGSSGLLPRMAGKLVGLDVSDIADQLEQGLIFDDRVLSLVNGLVARLTGTQESLALVQKALLSVDESLTRLEVRSGLERADLRSQIEELREVVSHGLAAHDAKLEALELRNAAADDLARVLERFDASGREMSLIWLVALVAEMMRGPIGEHVAAEPDSEVSRRVYRSVSARLPSNRTSVASLLDSAGASIEKQDCATLGSMLRVVSGGQARGPWVGMSLCVLEFRSLPEADRPDRPGALAVSLARLRWAAVANSFVPELAVRDMVKEWT